MADSSGRLLIILIIVYCCYPGYALLEPGYFDISLNENERAAVFQKSVYANTQIDFYVYDDDCRHSYNYYDPISSCVAVSFYLLWFPCARDFRLLLGKGDQPSIESFIRNIKYGSSLYQQEIYWRRNNSRHNDDHPFPRNLFVTEERKSGTHVFICYIDPGNKSTHSVAGSVWLNGPRGYLSKTEWPLLPFYGTMMALYAVCLLVWCGAMIVWCNLKHRVWVQGSIPVVLILGVVEYAVIFAGVKKLNEDSFSNGNQVAAEVMSSIKRTLAVMVSILISLGHSINRPRCGATLGKVLGVGFLYLIAASAEGCVRVYLDHNDIAVLSSRIPLITLDVTLCCVILSFMSKTIAKLRDSKHNQELTLYKHCRNAVIFVGAASSGYYMLILLEEQLDVCLDTRVVWLKDGFWHILFFLVLLGAMVLWRPSVKYNRYRPEYLPLSEEESPQHDDDDKLLDLGGTDGGITGEDKQDALGGGVKTKGIIDGEGRSAKDSPCGGLKSTMAAIINGINNTFKNSAEMTEIKKNKIKKELEKSGFEIENMKLENELLRLKISEKLKEQPTPLEQPKDPQQLEQAFEPQQLELSQQLEQSEPQLTEQKEGADKVAVDEGLVPVHQYTAQ